MTTGSDALASSARACARIDLDAIAANVERLRSAAGDASVMAVVKADAYGHGLVPCARRAVASGAAYLGVALPEEALALRSAGIDAPILSWLLRTDAVDDYAACIAADVEVSVSSPAGLQRAIDAAAAVGRPARVHLKVDTGLGRAGAPAAQWEQLCAAAAAAEAADAVEIVAVWSHLAIADEPDHPVVRSQREAFVAALDAARRQGITPPLRHLANSAATLRTPDAAFDLVRPGIAVYGLSPGPGVGAAEELGLRPAMRMSARVMLAKRLPAGHGISYGHRYTTTAETTTAVLPVGYADGVPRNATNIGPLLLAGRRRTIAGRVCMDQVVVDVGDDAVHEGDEAVLFGPGDEGEPTADDWADATGTIGYEIVTRIGPRVPRVHVGEQG